MLVGYLVLMALNLRGYLFEIKQSESTFLFYLRRLQNHFSIAILQIKMILVFNKLIKYLM